MKSCFNKKKTYLIFGTGITGKSAVEFCIKHKLSYYITDDNIENLKNIHVPENNKIYSYNNGILSKKNIDYIILSPSIHAEYKPHKIVLIAKKLNIEIIPDIDLFYCYLQEYSKKNKIKKYIIGITGTNGKSTTTSLTAYLLNSFGHKAIACGNIGVNTLSLNIDKYDYFVVEMSSYNLYLMNYCKFDNSILLNITEDHISYHGTIKNYAMAKEKIISNSKHSVICIDDKYTKNIYKNHTENISVSTNSKTANFYVKNDKFYKKDKMVFKGEFQNLLGEHNIQNILCSVVCVSKILKNVEIKNIFNNVKNFKGLPHRNQFVKKICGIDFYNDSKGTNADSTQKALQTFKNRPIYLIAGGQRKTAGFHFLKNDLSNVKAVFLIGEATDSFAKELDELKIKYYKCNVMKNAVKTAFEVAKHDNLKQSVVLLSPLCASWDQYRSFEHRGKDFVNIVKRLSVCKFFRIFKSHHSFTIIELSVALAVIGTVLGGGLTAYKMSNPKLKNDLSKMQKIEEALQVFFNTNGRLPYPAYYKSNTADSNYLKENSDNVKEINTQQETETIENKILFGVIPTRTLGLSDDYAYDSYGKNIEYIINSSLAEKIGNENNNYKKTNYNTNRDGQYAISYANKDDEKDIVMVAPKLSVKSIKNNQIMTNNAGYILISKQKQNNCYISARTNQVNENIPSNDEKLQNNCFANENIEHFYQGYSNDFDEIVMFMGLNEMVYSSANTNEAINEMTQGNIIQYQPRISKKLTTEKKDVVGSINEIDYKLKFVDSFKGVVGERKQLYYLYVEQDSFIKDDAEKTYKRGLYIYNEDKEDFKLVSGGGGGAPVGSIIAFAGEHIPSGYLVCDGKAYDRFMYKELFDIIGTTYGAGDGLKTFNVPDLRDKLPWQSGDLSGKKEIGEEILSGLPDHRHWISNSAVDDNNDTGTWARGQYPGLKSDASSWEVNDRLYIYGRYSAWASYSSTYSDDVKYGYVSYAGSRNAYGTSTIVQPPALSMRFIIKYTDDTDAFKEYEQKVNDFTDEVKKQLAEILTDEYICKKQYPVGSIYMNATDSRNPLAILGCGTWVSVTANRYLMAASPNIGDNADYDAYNNRYGNFAGIELNECISNITGSLNYYNGYGSSGGGAISVWVVNSNWLPSSKEEHTSRYCSSFNAANGSATSVFTRQKLYRGSCGAVRPQTYPVYIWRRVE